ncbi:hypothetical protein BH11BAC1_BH11BAC1_14300 [soil metagenome]
MKKKSLFALLIILAGLAALYLFIARSRHAGNYQNASHEVDETTKSKTPGEAEIYFNNMENSDLAIWLGERSSEKYFSGKFSTKLSGQDEYGMTFSKKGIEIESREKIRQVKISFQVFSDVPLKKASYVFAVPGVKGKMYEYFQEPIKAESGKWSSNEFILSVNPALWGEDATVKIYPWNVGKEMFFLDDIRIEFLPDVESQMKIALGPQQNYFFDFEPHDDYTPASKLSTDEAHSGSHSILLDGSDTYSETFQKKFYEIATDTIKFISTSAWIYATKDNPSVALVVSTEKPDGTSISWQGKESDKMNLKKNEWHKINFRADLRGLKTSPDDIIKIYLWNKKGGTVYADDLEIVYGEIPQPTGGATGMTMNIYGNPISHDDKNKAPFFQSFFSQAALFTPISNYLVDGEGRNEGEMNPENMTLSGKFTGRHFTHDDIFIADRINWSLYRWCDKNFIQTFSTIANAGIKWKLAFTGNFENPEQDEVLLVDTGSKITIATIRFNSAFENACNKKASDKIKMVTTAEEIKGVQANNCKIAAGNFSGDGKQEIILIPADGQWKILAKNIGGWEDTGTGIISRGTLLSIHRVSFGDNHDKLLAFFQHNQKLDYCLLDFSKGKNTCVVSEFKDKSFLAHYSPHSEFISGSFENSTSPDIFYFAKEWRFDLKKVRLTADGLIIESQVDFAQSDPSRNPKYYEYTNLVTGKFFAGGIDYLLIQMRNCKDKNFEGRSCNEFEEAKGMPSGYIFYQYKPVDRLP